MQRFPNHRFFSSH